METPAYQNLAKRLNELPNGFPPTPDGAEIRLLSALFSEEEAELTAHLRLTLETADQVADRLGMDSTNVKTMLHSLAKRGLISAGRGEGGIGYGLMPFVVGFYEMQVASMDVRLAQLVEDYYLQAFPKILDQQPTFHRVIPVRESIHADLEVRPYESVDQLLDRAEAWGVLDCICRKQKALIGEGCEHPIDVCMALSPRAGAFDHNPVVKPLDKEGAKATLRRAAQAGLVHTVSNNQEGNWYVCNCCTCSCGILRGMAELGLANAVARSEFVNQVDEALCQGCQICVDYCQFNALVFVSAENMMTVDRQRCVGCGVCIVSCPEEALSLVNRPADEIKPPPATEADWRNQRAASRGIDIERVL